MRTEPISVIWNCIIRKRAGCRASKTSLWGLKLVLLLRQLAIQRFFFHSVSVVLLCGVCGVYFHIHWYHVAHCYIFENGGLLL